MNLFVRIYFLLLKSTSIQVNIQILSLLIFMSSDMNFKWHSEVKLFKPISGDFLSQFESNFCLRETTMGNKRILYNLEISPPARTVRTVAKLLGLELELRYLNPKIERK